MSRFLTDIRKKGASKAALAVEQQHETSMFVPEEKLREEDLVKLLPVISAEVLIMSDHCCPTADRNLKCS